MDSEAQIFMEEAYELLDDIEETLLELQKTEDDSNLIGRLFRAIHTVKGSGAMFGFTRIADFAHKFETVIDSIRQGKATLNENLLNNFLIARDHILTMLNNPEAADSEIQSASEKIIADMNAALSGDLPQQQKTEVQEASPTPPSPKPESSKILKSAPSTIRPERPKTISLKKPAARTGTSGLKILVVEDEFISRYLLQEFLMPFGTSHIAINGYEAVVAFQRSLTEKQPYELICLDIMMPGLDGRDVAKEIRRIEKEIKSSKPCKIVLTTCLQDETAILKMFQEKLCDAYFSKPLNLDALGEKIQEFFSG